MGWSNFCCFDNLIRCRCIRHLQNLNDAQCDGDSFRVRVTFNSKWISIHSQQCKQHLQIQKQNSGVILLRAYIAMYHHHNTEHTQCTTCLVKCSKQKLFPFVYETWDTLDTKLHFVIQIKCKMETFAQKWMGNKKKRRNNIKLTTQHLQAHHRLFSFGLRLSPFLWYHFVGFLRTPWSIQGRWDCLPAPRCYRCVRNLSILRNTPPERRKMTPAINFAICQRWKFVFDRCESAVMSYPSIFNASIQNLFHNVILLLGRIRSRTFGLISARFLFASLYHFLSAMNEQETQRN